MIGVWAALYSQYTLQDIEIICQGNNLDDTLSTLNNKNIISNIASYFIALLATASVELVLAKNEDKILNNTMTIFGFGCLAIGVFLFLISINTDVIYGYIAAVAGVIFSWLIWWISNSENSNLTNEEYLNQMTEGTKHMGENWS